MGKSIDFGDISFASEKELMDYIRGVRDGAALFEPLTGTVGLIVAAVFDAHPEAEQKVAGREISHHEVRPYKFGRRAFFVVFKDGSAIDFSWKKGVKGLFNPE